MRELPIFPLGSVLMPGMPLALRVFEDRYLAMLRDLLDAPGDGPREFGVVLIERGHEVGGGDARFGLGTIARIGDVHRAPNWLNVLARGTDRFEVVSWQPDDPYPRAEVHTLPALPWTPDDSSLLTRADKVVRRGLARASEFGDQQWRPSVQLPGEGLDLAWRLAGVAPIEALDHQALLGSVTASGLLSQLIDLVQALDDTWAAFLE